MSLCYRDRSTGPFKLFCQIGSESVVLWHFWLWEWRESGLCDCVLVVSSCLVSIVWRPSSRPARAARRHLALLICAAVVNTSNRSPPNDHEQTNSAPLIVLQLENTFITTAITTRLLPSDFFQIRSRCLFWIVVFDLPSVVKTHQRFGCLLAIEEVFAVAA